MEKIKTSLEATCMFIVGSSPKVIYRNYENAGKDKALRHKKVNMLKTKPFWS